MRKIAIQVDQTLHVGGDITVRPTDIGPNGVRLVASGRVMGGPSDGEPFEKAYEIAVGGSLHLGPHVVVTLEAVKGPVARLGVFVPRGIDIAGPI